MGPAVLLADQVRPTLAEVQIYGCGQPQLSSSFVTVPTWKDADAGTVIETGPLVSAGMA
jgi:hypothetical protein